ncbi:ABC transporter permease [Candidatus Aerophobetes bacterium]|uniref:ABC transporter permease n=2 Tax=Aerophobetes bacterium TaxID=2030807 RepID=A0A497E2I6_UNCAE|nr:MAG: ABC transporter permease [Candidatus Aerophobetes bacterium]
MEPRIKELKFSFSRIKKSPLSLVGLFLILFFVIIAVLAPELAPPKYPHNPYRIPRYGYSAIPRPPSPEHPFGLTEGQYDIYYGVIWGTRTAFRIGFIVVGSILVIGIVLGSISGYYGGIVDEIIMRVVDTFMSLPTLVLAMALVTALGRSLDNVMKALIIVGWPSYARLIRGDILTVREEGYVEAARAVGCSDLRVILKHVLPNAIYPLLIMASLDIGAMVLTAAALSFLGLGAPVGYADWGQMVSFARNWIVGPPDNPLAYWYTITIPGLFILFFVLGWNLLGDAFRDILDPKLRRR